MPVCQFTKPPVTDSSHEGRIPWGQPHALPEPQPQAAGRAQAASYATRTHPPPFPVCPTEKPF